MHIHPVQESSHIAEMRRAVTQTARLTGFDEEEQGRVALVVTELGTNLVKHAGGGSIIFGTSRISGEGGRPALDCVAIDTGPGMRNIDQCMVDGFSTAGSQGTGLGAVLRQSTVLDIHSQAGMGTAIFARLEPGNAPYLRSGRQPALYPAGGNADAAAGLNMPKPGEEVCGDNWQVRKRQDGFIALVADGLGHGGMAADASRLAVDLFDRDYERPPAEILERLHTGLRQTRGAAVAVAFIDEIAGQLRVASVGNIAGLLIGGDSTRRLLSHSGTVGHAVRKIQEVAYPLQAHTTLILMSDGIATSWAMERYIGLLGRHPLTIASVLYRDYQRGTDDATVLVLRP